MTTTILSEIFISIIFHSTLFIGYYDKIEEFTNKEKRKMHGYIILFSMIG